MTAPEPAAPHEPSYVLYTAAHGWRRTCGCCYWQPEPLPVPPKVEPKSNTRRRTT